MILSNYMNKKVISEYHRKNGRKGGKALLKKYGKKHMSDIGKLGAIKKYKKHG